MPVPVIARAAASVAIVLALAATGCGKKPDRKTFDQAWQAAVAAKDGGGAWKLLDQDSRARIIDGLTRSQARAAADAPWKALLAAVNAPIDTAQPPEALAIAMLSAQLGAATTIADDGKTPHIHLEDGAWRARVEPVGFTADGVPLSMRLRLPAADPPITTSTTTQVKLPALDRFTGQRVPPAEREASYQKAAAHVAENAALPPHFAEGAARLMMQFHFGDYGAVEPPMFDFAPMNVITPSIPVYDEANHYVRVVAQPPVTYGPWPAAK